MRQLVPIENPESSFKPTLAVMARLCPRPASASAATLSWTGGAASSISDQRFGSFPPRRSPTTSERSSYVLERIHPPRASSARPGRSSTASRINGC